MQACKYLDECLIYGIKPSLVRINKILELIGQPHKKTSFIHVVGSNGKTSTTIMTARILNAHSLKSAYHISPHINEYTERLWYEGKNISKSRFAGLLNDLYPFIQEVNSLDLGGPVTQFEILAAMAFKLAYDEKIDAMVLEAGMGGRWDATNSADSKVVGLTGVSLEHTAFLGKTISQIAIEKSKVIKNNAMVATLSKDKKVLEVLKKQVFQTGSKLYVYDSDFSIISSRKIKNLPGWTVSIKGINGVYENIYLPLCGNYQPKNLALSAAISELFLGISKNKAESQKIKKAVSNIEISGRFEIINKKPLVIADTSHNPEGVKNFVQNIKRDYAYGKKIIIFSVLKDKDFKKMLSYVLEIADILILSSSNTSRSMHVELLEKELQKLISAKNTNAGKKWVKIKDDFTYYKIKSIVSSLNYALKITDSNDIICITGSITNLEGIV